MTIKKRSKYFRCLHKKCKLRNGLLLIKHNSMDYILFLVVYAELDLVYFILVVFCSKENHTLMGYLEESTDVDCKVCSGSLFQYLTVKRMISNESIVRWSEELGRLYLGTKFTVLDTRSEIKGGDYRFLFCLTK